MSSARVAPPQLEHGDFRLDEPPDEARK
jgi:hypothetical protein